jgi:hypothetical protein
MPPPELPRFQDCHELWSKKRRRQQREQVERSSAPSSMQTQASESGAAGGAANASNNGNSSDAGAFSKPSSCSQPGSEKIGSEDTNSLQG